MGRSGMGLWVLVLTLVLAGCAGPRQPPVSVQAVPEAYVTAGMLAEIRELYGASAANRVSRWQALIDTAPEYSLMDNLRRVNDFFNGAAFVDDIEVWGREDYWATPLEFLIVDAGDCEDFAMAKYFTLRQMGIDPDTLRMTYCRATTINQAHMVVSYYPARNSSPLILDNLDRRILPAPERSDLIPVYSFNGDSLWLARQGRGDHEVSSPDTMKPWQSWRTRTAQRQVPRNLVVFRR